MTRYVQDHIHLDTVLGGAPENAPTTKWIVQRRVRKPVIFLQIDYTAQGYIRANKLTDGSDPVLLKDWQYTLKVVGDGTHDYTYYEDQLVSMLGKVIYLVDNYHEDDGADHTDSVQAVIMDTIDGMDSETDKVLRFGYITITLRDASRL
jgi:hypothetical protein